MNILGLNNAQLIDCSTELIQANNKDTIKALCGGNPMEIGRFPSQKASDVNSVPKAWRHDSIVSMTSFQNIPDSKDTQIDVN